MQHPCWRRGKTKKTEGAQGKKKEKELGGDEAQGGRGDTGKAPAQVEGDDQAEQGGEKQAEVKE